LEEFIRTITATNFRMKPTTESAVITKLKAGERLQVLEKLSGTTWYRAKLMDGTTGYITSKPQYVEPYVPKWLETAKKVVEYGEQFLGVPYVYGSKRFDETDFDCSDFVQYILYKAAGIKIDANSRSQSNDGVTIDPCDIRTGDLLFFDTNRDGQVNHVAMYVYPNKILHTANKTGDVFDRNLNLIRKGGGGVTFAPFTQGSYYHTRLTNVQRVIFD